MDKNQLPGPGGTDDGMTDVTESKAVVSDEPKRDVAVDDDAAATVDVNVDLEPPSANSTPTNSTDNEVDDPSRQPSDISETEMPNKDFPTDDGTSARRDSVLGGDMAKDDVDPIAAYAHRENLFLPMLQNGFTRLRESRENKGKPLFGPSSSFEHKSTSNNDRGDGSAPDDSAANDEAASLVTSKRTFVACATVNFIDPTTKGDSSPSPTTNSSGKQNFLSRAAAATTSTTASSDKGRSIEDVFKKLTLVFDRDYGSTLRSVPYKSLRGGGNETISNLPVRPVLTRSHQTNARGGTASVPWGGTAGSAAAPVTEPSEWHNAPFCHVFIAAIDNLDQYKAKVRPSLQAFVSQIESAATNAQPESLGANSAHYLIVYVPTGSKTDTSINASGSGETSTPPASLGSGAVRNALANRLQKARKRFAKTTGGDDMSNDSLHSTDTFESADIGGGPSDPDDPGSERAALSLLTRSERSIFAKVSNDFPTAKICVLSTTSLDVSSDESVASSDVTAKSQEWNCFNRMLGSVIVNGFRDRCRRYTDELRRLDAQRASTLRGNLVQDNKRGRRRNNSASIVEFNVCHFFLVKESLAFTFEQMQLPSEALLQYDELKIYLPDVGPDKVKRRHKSRSVSQREINGPTLIDLADSGDYAGFRRRIRSETDLEPIADVVRRYLFSREISLLFEMDQPADLLERCRDFIETMHAIMVRGISELTDEEKQYRKLEAAKWVVKFIWDIKYSTDHLLATLGGKDKHVDTISVDTPSSPDFYNAGMENNQSEQFVARQLADMLEMARLFFKKIGEIEFPGDNPMRIETEHPHDMQVSWNPWEASVAGEKDARTDAEEEWLVTNKYRITHSSLSHDTFESVHLFESKFVELTAAVVTLSQFSGRKRFASKLKGELAEYYISKGNLRHGAAIIKSIVKLYRGDQWDRCHFWRLYRLAYCQRTTAESTDYLKTLVTCFSPRTSSVAPKKALLCLQDDLDLVIADPLVGQARYGKLAFIDTQMEMVNVTDTVAIEVATERKKLKKNSCRVGESVNLSVTVTSHLPKAIALDSLKLFIVAFDSFNTIADNNDSIEEEDAFKVLPYVGSIHLKPGKSEFEFEWLPMSPGQFIISTVEIKWQQGFFYYDNMELGQPLFGVDVMPCDATHGVAIEPSYLIPGHDQEIRVKFTSGSDIIRGGILELLCPPGFVIAPQKGNGAEESKQEHRNKFMITSCEPNSDQVFTAQLRSTPVEPYSSSLSGISETTYDSADSVIAFRVKAMTKYHHINFDPSIDSRSLPMKAVMETVAPILSHPALTVYRAHAQWYPRGDKAMISISLDYNIPNAYDVHSWNLSLRSPLKVAPEGDLNANLKASPLLAGEQIQFAFECNCEQTKFDDGSKKGDSETMLTVNLQDDIGKLFPVRIPLDVKSLYKRLGRDGAAVGMTSPTVEMKLDRNEGLVGEPVKMQFSALRPNTVPKSEVKLVFSITSNSKEWLLAGKISGVWPAAKSGELSTFDVIAIPTVAGTITTFPKLALSYQATDGSMKLVALHSKQPRQYKSRSLMRHISVASLKGS